MCEPAPGVSCMKGYSYACAPYPPPHNGGALCTGAHPTCPPGLWPLPGQAVGSTEHWVVPLNRAIVFWGRGLESGAQIAIDRWRPSTLELERSWAVRLSTHPITHAWQKVALTQGCVGSG